MLPYETSLPLRIELRPSRWLRLMLVALALCASVALWRSQLPAALVLLLPVMLAPGWPRQRNERVLVLRADGSAAALDAEGNERPCQVETIGLRGPLAVLALSLHGRTRRVTLLPDTLPRRDARLLRLWAERHVDPPTDPRSAARV